MPDPLIDIRPDHWVIVADILRRHVPDREVWAFGSRAKWNDKEYSDLDLAVIGETPLSLSVSAALSSDFSGSDLPFKVDVVDWATISESFRQIIERDKVVLQEGKRTESGMGGEWREAALGDVIELKRGYDLPQRDRIPGSVPLVSSSGVTAYHSVAMVKGPGVVTGRYGTLGQVFYVKEDFWPLNTTLYVRDFKGNDPRFVSYFLRGLDFLAYSDKAAVSGLNRNHLHQADVRIPPDVGEQRAIAHILGTLDDKIELNQRMSETLEAMARALFKSWFVDFDPVRAKQPKNVGWLSPSGRNPPDKADGGLRDYAANPPYELPPHIADLFPDRFQDSELGEIPAGWDMGTLGDVAKHPRRGVQPDKIDAATPYIALEHIPKRCIALSEWGVANGLESNKFEFKRGEILFGKLRPYFHKVGVAPVDSVCSTDIVVVTSREEAWFGFMLGHVSSTAFVDYTNAGSTGTKMPRTSWSEMARYPVVIPPESVAQAFTTQIRPAVERIIASIHESCTLAALRDTLLPKLITGELRVKDAGRVAVRET
ncbi:MAG: restriction endonuclease subunit S [Gammaproteobacteria bacterium]